LITVRLSPVRSYAKPIFGDTVLVLATVCACTVFGAMNEV
jgi:hypothetical protein